MEMDADIYSANQITRHCWEYWLRQHEELQTPELLHKLLATSITSIFVFFLCIQKYYRPFYFRETKHPHPIVRIVYIIDYMLHAIRTDFGEDFQISDTEILRDVFNLTEEIVKDSIGTDGLREYANILVGEKQNIEEYIRELQRASDQIPFLVRHQNMEI